MYKPLADSTLLNMTKKEIIELLRTAEHNAEVSQEWVEQQAENLKDWEPVVHGTWLEKEEETYCPVLYGEDAEPILHKYTRYICNLCGRSSTVPEPYCHCGAKMDNEPIPFAEIDETRRKYEAFCREKGYNDE